MKRMLLAAALFASPLALGGCYDDPEDPKTWIKQLDDPRDQKEAVRQLVKLKDKAAVPALVTLYKKSHDPEHLKAIASFADPGSVDVLIEAMDYSDESFDSASVAATALGEIGDKKAVDVLVTAATKKLPVKSRANVVRAESIKALAKLKDPKAVDALIRILQTSADDQDFYLNKLAAKALGEISDPKAAPALVRGLFMTGRGSDIFPECRTALLGIGAPSVDPLVAAMQRKNEDIELDAKKYEFLPGIVVQKTAIVLGDLRAKKAAPALLGELGKKDEGLAAGAGKGVSGHQSVIVALGQIGDPAAKAPLLAILGDAKKPDKHRSAAAEALNLLGDRSALPTLLAASKTKWLNGSTIDPTAAGIAAAATTAYSRLADKAGAATTFPKLDPELADMAEINTAANDRLAVARECDKDAACYAKYLGSDNVNQAEKAAFELSRLGKAQLPVLTKQIGSTKGNGVVRMAVLYAIAQLGDKSSTDVRKALDDQIELDKTKPPLKGLVEEMMATRALISSR